MNDQPKRPISESIADGYRSQSIDKLRASQNPALARVARAVEARDSDAAAGPENYSRMHHRHNRD